MANKLIKHDWNNYDSAKSSTVAPLVSEPDKTKSISELSLPELYKMMERLRSEYELENIIRNLKQNSGERDTCDIPFKIDTTTPINQIYHHGIMGQKWGVRRFQNKDGTRTPAGKKREKSEDHISSRQAKSKATSGLSNEELRKLNERLQLEETYKRLSKEDIQKSESWVKKAIKSGGEQALGEFSKGVFLGSAKLLVKEISPEFAEIAFKVKKKKDD